MAKWPAGVRRTKQRNTVFDILASADKPISAVEICSRAGASGQAVWLSTVYRILEMLVKERAVSKLAVMDSDMALYELIGSGHRHYAVCIGCRKIISMENCPMERFLPQLKDADFRVTGHNLEVYGYCGQCDTPVLSGGADAP
ncbi:MAG: transcriptional repressor [Oscillospiraceae bacterium]|jgi:Fur family ferric uptake transcriptional regulator|nr:transcriptional repressor [Oscillospiraceae bacterium]